MTGYFATFLGEVQLFDPSQDITDKSDVLLPGSTPPFELRNPTILEFRKRSLDHFARKFPSLSSKVLQAILDECRWNLNRAKSRCVEFNSQIMEEENSSLLQSLISKYPEIERAVIVLALRKGPDKAEMHLQDESLRSALQIAISTPVEPVIPVDMHGVTWTNAPNFVRDTLKELQPEVERVHFIAGCGRGVQNEVPLLGPLVLKILEEEGIECQVMVTNPGIVQGFVRQSREEGSRTSSDSRRK
jgi:hypothetical protein